MLRKHPSSHQIHQSTQPYVGRFAPSPTGPLHFGSLICALASYLHAKQANGTWLVRIEDIDTPRVDDLMSPRILNTLLAHGMQWDNDVVYQSQRHSLYESTVDRLKRQHSLYACKCSRKQIRARAEYYDQYCRNLHLPFENNAIRWQNDAQRTSFYDLHFSNLVIDNYITKEDPVIKRADGIYAYHLAVVADDIEQHITHVVRGADLIDTTPLHISLFEALNKPAPVYLHIPVAASSPGHKLSKQQLAPEIDNNSALNNLKSALIFLGVNKNAISTIDDVDTLIEWAIINWQAEYLSLQTEILVSHTNGVYYIDK